MTGDVLVAVVERCNSGDGEGVTWMIVWVAVSVRKLGVGEILAEGKGDWQAVNARLER
jgi:hypothetical protein